MLNTGKKICALRDKKISILILVLSENKILNEAKNHNLPPFKLNGWSFKTFCFVFVFVQVKFLRNSEHSNYG